MSKKGNTNNLTGRLFTVLFITLLYLVTGIISVVARGAVETGDRDGIGLSMIRDDGIRVLIRENGTYYCNTGLTFVVGGKGALCEYCLCPEGDENSAYKEIDNGMLRLSGKEYSKKEGNWIVSFRASDMHDPGRLIWSAGPYRICFDVTAPTAELSLEKSALIPDTVKAGINMADEKSGISYAELRQEGEILYRQDFPAKNGLKPQESVRLFRRTGQIKGKRLKLYVMDRAGNERVVESGYHDAADKPARGPVSFVSECLKLFFRSLPMPDEKAILAGCIAVSLTLIGLLGELMYRILYRIWSG